MKHLLIRFSLVFLWFPTFSTALSAQTTYYVATPEKGGNDANSGTSLAAPFATIVKAISKAIVPGDSILVRSGTYVQAATVDMKKTGTAAKHCVLSVYLPDMINANSRPVFDFSSMVLASANRGFSLSGANYWDIYGIVILGAGDNGMILSNSSYTTITFCSFSRNRDTGLQIGNLSHHVTVVNCDSYENADIGQQSSTNGGNADGFAPKLDVGDSIIFRGCRAWLNSDDGWDGYSRPANNVSAFLEDCWAFNNGFYWLDGSTTSSQNGNGFKLGGSDSKDLAHNFTVIRCLAFYNKAKGFDQNSNAGSIYLYNNTAYKNGLNDFFMTSSPVTYQPGAQLVMKNNISFGPKGVSLPTASTASRSLITATNVFSTAVTHPEVVSFDTTGITGARGVDGSLPVLNFMRLNTAASQPYTYINQGTPLPEVVYHGSAGLPYSGSAPDLGFFESELSLLPSRLLSFNAQLKDNDLTLNWKANTEAGFRGWEVERSIAAGSVPWLSLGFIKNNSGAGFSFPDKNLSSGLYYYRLKQFEQDGSFSYSNQLAVNVNRGRLSIALEIFPNPVSSATTIRYVIPADDMISLGIYSSDGRLVQNVVAGLVLKGSYQQSINGGSLPAGSYQVRLASNGQIKSLSFLKK